MKHKAWEWKWVKSSNPKGIKNLCEYYRHGKRDGAKIKVWLVTEVDNSDYYMYWDKPVGTNVFNKHYTTRVSTAEETENNPKLAHSDDFEDKILKRIWIGGDCNRHGAKENKLWKYNYSNIRRVEVWKKCRPDKIRKLWDDVTLLRP